MKIVHKSLLTIAVTAALISTSVIAGSGNTVSNAGIEESTSKLLTAHFLPRQVVKIEAGDFHFVAGQVAPIHTHAAPAPAIGYIAKGKIIYQVEGEKPQLLGEGDAFYEPAGPRILRFDNASATEEAIFIDFNLQQQGEPFIVFEEALTEHIDRRMLPTVNLSGQSINQADIFVSEIEPKGHKQLTRHEPLLGYVAEGIIKLKVKDEETLRLVAGESFSITTEKAKASVDNVSSEVPAKVVMFYLR